MQLNAWINQVVRVDCLYELLDYEGLDFESTHMAIVNHHSERLLENLSVEELVEARSGLRTFFENNDQGVHAIKAKLHEFRFFMLHREDYCKYNTLEGIRIKHE